MAADSSKRGDSSKIIPLGQTKGPYGNDPFYKGRAPVQSNQVLKPQ